MSDGWSVYVILLTVLNLVGCGWLLYGNRNVRVDPEEKGRSTGHDFDGIEELNNPLPAWWTWLFVVTLVFGVAYLVLYPGLGSFAGLLGWSSESLRKALAGPPPPAADASSLRVDFERLPAADATLAPALGGEPGPAVDYPFGHAQLSGRQRGPGYRFELRLEPAGTR